jgi:hypothetical protein
MEACSVGGASRPIGAAQEVHRRQRLVAAQREPGGILPVRAGAPAGRAAGRYQGRLPIDDADPAIVDDDLGDVDEIAQLALIWSGESEADLIPLRLVADAFLLADRQATEPFTY